MRNSTAENLANRLSWLEEVLNRIIPIHEQIVLSLKTMRSFCGLEIKGRFETISYNTLHTAAMNTSARIKGHSNWAYMADLRQQCYDTFKTSEQPPPASSIQLKDAAAQALLDAHICSMAYLEIFQFLEKLISQPDEIPTRTHSAIKNQLAISREKFKYIASYNEIHNSIASPLKLVNR